MIPLKNHAFKATLLALVLCFPALLAAQLQSPSEFLGREVGDAFTHHHELMDYAQHISEQSDRAVRKVYGKSYQGRELSVMIFASKQNMARIEEIRQNNLRLTGMLDGEVDLENAPSVVWLSYNVHGNEPSCSESALLTMYALADEANKETSEWLENAVVIIDPVLNPDGRQRYVHNFTQNVGRFPNADPIAREHRWDWPSGRTNHYYFDLNRDWAWQTQVESQQRAVIYQEWMPHVHADYHEMGYNSPYFFAPAAEPFHLAITPFQKSFQQTIGENHVRHFEKQGWLYYTGQVFDLFYPSYGDTWPTFNGAIGMTYEQGGIRAGLEIVTMAGDTLTLSSRAAHHFTTSLSTIEASAVNRTDLVQNFKKYFDDAQKADSYQYKAYGIRASNNRDKVERLLNYLDKQQISYSYADGSQRVQGYDFFEGSSGRINVEASDIIIPANQPKGTLVRVLFEPNPVLTDSVTYDITSWQAHYVHGLHGYASERSINTKSADDFELQWQASAMQVDDQVENVYAFLTNWSSLSDASFVAELLRSGIKLRYADTPFKLKGYDFDRGTIIATRADNQRMKNFETHYRATAQKHNRWYLASATGFTEEGADLGSNNVHVLEKPEVLMLAHSDISQYSLGELWHFFDQEMGYPVTIVDAENFDRINLSRFHVMILPEGYYNGLLNKSMDRVQSWVRDGGSLVAVGRAVSYLSSKDAFSIKAKKEEEKAEKADHMDYDTYAERERAAISNVINGAIYPVKLDNSHPLGYGMDEQYFTLKLEATHYATNESLWNVGVITQSEPNSGFSGSKAKQGIKNSVSLAVEDMGRGRVVYFVDNLMYRAFWINGKLMLANAVLFR